MSALAVYTLYLSQIFSNLILANYRSNGLLIKQNFTCSKRDPFN